MLWLLVRTRGALFMRTVVCISCRQHSVASCCGDLGIQGAGDQLPKRKGLLGKKRQVHIHDIHDVGFYGVSCQRGRVCLSAPAQHLTKGWVIASVGCWKSTACGFSYNICLATTVTQCVPVRGFRYIRKKVKEMISSNLWFLSTDLFKTPSLESVGCRIASSTRCEGRLSGQTGYPYTASLSDVVVSVV